MDDDDALVFWKEHKNQIMDTAKTLQYLNLYSQGSQTAKSAEG